MSGASPGGVGENAALHEWFARGSHAGIVRHPESGTSDLAPTPPSCLILLIEVTL